MTVETAAVFVLAVVLLLCGAKAFGAIARRMGQPAVIGEIVAGILAGQLVMPILPAEVTPLIQAVAVAGLALFMFTVGHELDPALLQGRRRTVLGIAAGSVLVPLIGGIALAALLLTPEYTARSELGLVLFMGVAMSVTALPVLARIVSDRGLDGRPLGGLALAAAAVGDVVAWLALAGLAAFAGTANQWRACLLPVYVLVLVIVVRPLLKKLLRSVEDGRVSPIAIVPVLACGLIWSCATTEWVGVHYIFGALAFGAAMPRIEPRRRGAWVIDRAHRGALLLVPVYFVVAGAKVNLALDGLDWSTLIIIVAVAVTTKAVGGYGGARLVGLRHRVALPLAVLVNVRGLTEIVMLSVGLELNLIDSRVYSMMVVMALVTTAMAGPVLRAIGIGPRPLRAPREGMSRPRPALARWLS